MDATVISLAEHRATLGRTGPGAVLGSAADGSRPVGPEPSGRPEPERGRPGARAWRRTIGHLLRAARLDAELRLVDVARAAGVSPQYLSEVERGVKEPSSEVLAAVTGALGMTLVDLARDLTDGLTDEVAAPSGGAQCLAV